MNRWLTLALALVAIAAAGFALLTFEVGSRAEREHAKHPGSVGHDHGDIDAASRERLQALLEESGNEEGAR